MASLEEFGMDEKELTHKVESLITNAKWYHENKDYLKQNFVNKHLAIYKNSLIDSDEDLEVLKKKLIEKGLNLDYILLRYVHPKEIIYIL